MRKYLWEAQLERRAVTLEERITKLMHGMSRVDALGFGHIGRRLTCCVGHLPTRRQFGHMAGGGTIGQNVVIARFIVIGSQKA